MADPHHDGEDPLAPDEAFEVLGNEIRMEILQTLAGAQNPLPFSELRDRIGVSDSGQFNYHLDRLVGHFVGDTDTGYDLKRAGERVIEAVLSGAVTSAPTLEPTRIDKNCGYCGAALEVSYSEGAVPYYCTGCAGLFEDRTPFETDEFGYLGSGSLPPAGVQGRSATEVAKAGWIWAGLEILGQASGVCPRCSGPIEHSVRLCENHDTTEGRCDACDSVYAVHIDNQCTNCIYQGAGIIGLRLMANTEYLAFFTSRGINPLTDIEWQSSDYDEEILSTDPLRMRFTYTLDDDSIALTLDDELEVVEVTENSV